jgi:type IV secretion system protein VirB8
MTQDTTLEPYFQEAASWDADRAGQARRSARLAWAIAAAAVLCAVACSLAILFLTPLKSVQPFLVRVDNTTGVVDVVPPYDGKAALNETITRYLLSHYVTTCQRFTWATAESDYEECAAFHTTARNQEWAAAWAPANPASPLNLYRDGTSVRAEVESVSFFTRATGITDLAQVRYLKAARQGDGASEQFTHWIATVQYAYVAPASDPRLRRWNPLGLRIVEFKAEPEVAEGAGTRSAATAQTHTGGTP